MNQPIRTALLNDSFPPVIDGVANAVSNYAALLTASGCPALVATPEYPGAADDYAYPVVRYPSLSTEKLVGYRAGYPFSAKAARQILDFAPDILHAHCPMSSLLLARTLRESLHAPLIFTYHTKYDVDIRTAVKNEALQNQLIHALVRNIEAADEVWTVSRGAGENLESLGYRGAWRVMENGVDMPKGSASIDDVRAVSSMYNLTDETPVLLFVGRLKWYKGVGLILHGLHKAQSEGLHFRMLFAGEGSDRAEMEALAKSLGIADSCIFTGAVHNRDMLRALYSRADLLLFPSTFDTNGLVVREAAACGVPSLLIAGSCAAEGVTDGVNGLLTEENADALCQSVLHACRHREKLSQMGENAQRDIYISWDTAVGRAQARYAQLLQERREHPTVQKHDTLGALAADIIEAHRKIRELKK